MRNNSYPDYFSASGDSAALTTRVSDVMKRVYLKMFFAMLVTGFVSWWLASSQQFVQFYMTNSWLMWVVMFAELGLVFWISAGISRMSSSTATILFYIFSAVNGLMLTPIFLIYTHASIAKTFFITAAVFGAMSVYGFLTRTDLTSFGKILFFALIGLVICSLINIFVGSSTFEWIISIVGVLVFVGLTAWDTQQVKRMAQMAPADSVGHLATLGALTLYLDFINMFLFLLNIFGGNND
ncbi:MAG: Bax inhibitor-1/YccA family protein [Clostridium sp.]|nr:Bax inhibitor-1/YccA family protein [Clostridium sp.]